MLNLTSLARFRDSDNRKPLGKWKSDIFLSGLLPQQLKTNIAPVVIINETRVVSTGSELLPHY